MKILSRPWVLVRQYGMSLVVSKDNEIVLGHSTCLKLGDELVNFIVDAVNEKEDAE